MRVPMKGLDGSPVIVETNNITFLVQGRDMTQGAAGQVILNATNIFSAGGTMATVKGSPEEVDAILREGESYPHHFVKESAN